MNKLAAFEAGRDGRDGTDEASSRVLGTLWVVLNRPARFRAAIVRGGMACLTALLGTTAIPEVRIVVDHNPPDTSASAFHFRRVPPPAPVDAAAHATLEVVDGRKDSFSGGLSRLQDGRFPEEEDQPARNFFFEAGGSGGRIRFDFGDVIEIRAIHTYSWHPSRRGPQVYTVFGSEGQAADFDPLPKRGKNPTDCGWRRLTAVDTRSEDSIGGQYGVSLSDSNGSLGRFRYLLFDCVPTEDADAYGNTFYSEMDVFRVGDPEPVATEVPAQSEGELMLEAGAGRYRIAIDTAETPDLREWAREKLAPVVREWYPRIVELLPSDGFQAPERVRIVFRADMRGVAATGGTRISCAADWFRHNLEGEARGAVVHELVHVVQQYGRARRSNPDAKRSPGWLVEGLADYIRWFKYEPQSHGAEVRNPTRARYDSGYRVTANFLNWVAEKYGEAAMMRLNAVMRRGEYSEAFWTDATGHALEELGASWKAQIGNRAASSGAK